MSVGAHHRRAVFMLVLATLFWGVSFPTVKALLMLTGRLVPDGGDWFATFWALAPRFALAAPVLALAMLRGGRPTRSEWAQGLGVGFFATGGMIFQSDGLHFTLASTSAFLTQFYVILLPVWLAIRTRRNPGAVVWTSCILVLAGVAILGRFDWKTLRFGRGEWETLLSSCFFMGMILWIGKREYAANRPFPVTFVTLGLEAAIFLLLALRSAPGVSALLAPLSSPAWIGLTLILAIFCTVIPFTLMNAYQPALSPVEAGIIYCSEPIFGALFALVLPFAFSRWSGITYANENATLILVAGGGLILAANVLIQLVPSRPR